MASPSLAANVILERIRSLKVLVIGDVMLDHTIWGDAVRISPEAPVPVVEVERDTWSAGGAANVALNATTLGASATVVGRIGRDEAGRRLRRLLSDAGVRLFPLPAGDGPTIQKTRVMVRRQQLCRLDREADPTAYSLSEDDAIDALARAAADHDAIVFSDYAKGFLTSPLLARISAAARDADRIVALDPKPRRDLDFRDFDLLTPNRKEALEMAGMAGEYRGAFPAEEVCRALWKRHRTRNLVVTLGEDGMLLSRRGRPGHTIPTAAREVFDVSGAGDTVIGSLTLALAAGADLASAAHFANAAAGVVVAKVGTATVTPEELLASLPPTT
ncbi:MAG: hypothetical protein EA425_12315 [Puniceicoccaceae bacterium]|nr:MAG: hypothetical protein EA425_12315 [Puniceicoccaceae bacterium]